MQRLVERVGFFGILACASIPNPVILSLRVAVTNVRTQTKRPSNNSLLDSLLQKVFSCSFLCFQLFDLAGITCGHFLVPFWTFFGATLIGKAVIKMHIQKIFVILAFNQQLVESAIALLVKIPVMYSHRKLRDFSQISSAIKPFPIKC